MAKGISATGGTEAGYRSVLAIFRKDAEDRLPLLQAVPKAADLHKFNTQVHALKSASASIGAASISALAAELEAAGKAGNLELVEKRLPTFATQLAELVEGIRNWEEHCPEKTAATGEPANITPLLHELAAALESQKAESIDRILEQLAQQSLDADIKTTIEQISDEVLMAEYDKAREILEKLFHK
jgi:HPt (histidine-containing phosphotransfer) domain-containing protein